MLLDLDVALLRDFFTAFFANPEEKMWRTFLAWDMTRCDPAPCSNPTWPGPNPLLGGLDQFTFLA